MGYQLSETELDRLGTAFHEVGHAVAAVVLGGRVHRVIVGEQAHTEHDPLPGLDAGITYAGPWAEARWELGRPPGPADMRRALARNSSDDRTLCAAGGPHQGVHIVPLLERCWPSVKALAKGLYFTGTASHAEVCSALGLSPGDDGGPSSVALALIRSGLRAAV
ncbi:M50 family metallopeptidase [Mycolicibacterium diernhoferi]|uniref:Peptidase M41 domain-containing protein n=1 Tax=Mycolicibacterium diernhoferi TaxID=1801 RepID=A0A1Q4HMA6_9MYCO|nr:M50 family metallopeptidase [Mycolicibacterium diernhoferi]OJZ68656.1 hypothetical protein BRW64_03595 [Mycolicibacterium diernhoferi]OPE53943.1 hypothetical protein BV510_12905 [Mycolicibacterium diernhoferi]PEG51999.1 hypothetical protein CRI78_23475 [Mycolicibacterium diernhoferi]QYL20841.1 M50 family metallopeptidase [Mycolicibacterium diernhoferi]